MERLRDEQLCLRGVLFGGVKVGGRGAESLYSACDTLEAGGEHIMLALYSLMSGGRACYAAAVEGEGVVEECLDAAVHF